MKGKQLFGIGLVIVLMLTLLPGMVLAQEPAGIPLSAGFTYQGRLRIDDVPYNGICDFEVSLWDELSGGTQYGTTQSLLNVPLEEGFFTVLLDYGPEAFLGEHRFLNISVRCPAGGGSYEPLSPRQDLTPSPYSLYAMRSPWAGLVDMPVGFGDGVDNDTTYTAGVGLTLMDTTFSVEPSIVQLRVNGLCGPGFAMREVLQDGNVTCEPVGGGGGDAWLLTGNLGTSPGVNYIGTNDNTALVFKVNNERALRLEPNGISPNVIGGYIGNWTYNGAYGAAISGGGNSTNANIVTDSYGTIGGGAGNQAGDDAGTVTDAQYAIVGGGYLNVAGHDSATVAGGWANQATGSAATVCGGDSNIASGTHATVGGGLSNNASLDYSMVGGGRDNDATAAYATVGGGMQNSASDSYTTVAGGSYNTASGYRSTVGGGYLNSAGEYGSTVGGGEQNNASGQWSVVSGGGGNDATGNYATISGGGSNIASGLASMVPGGGSNVAQGRYSFAAGHKAKAYYDGCFVWGDSSDADITCDNQDRWVVRASGGVYFYTTAGFTSGVYVAAGGSSWNSISDRATKENFSPVDGQSILEKLASLPIQEYNLKSQDDSIRHVGLVAQDFATFGYGESDLAINMEDADGISLAAIQALYAENQVLKVENASQQQQIDALEVRLSALEAASHGTVAPRTWQVGLLSSLGLLVVGLAWVARRRRMTQ